MLSKTRREMHQQALMKLGCQRYGANSDNVLQYYARYGVQHIAANPGGPWTVENIIKMRKHAESYGISVEAAHIPWAISCWIVQSNVTRKSMKYVI